VISNRRLFGLQAETKGYCIIS